MTDNATELLRKLLDERGVKYETDDRNGLRETIWCGTAAFQLSPTAKMTMIVTPKQAIAATLGGANVDDALALLDEINEQGRIEYADYSQLHEAIEAWNTRAGRMCSCGWHGFIDGWGYEAPNYCPNCGAKVVS